MERFVSRVAWAIAGLVCISVFGLVFAKFPAETTSSVVDWTGLAVFIMIPASFAITGAAILSRQPRNMVGWTLMVPAVSFVASGLIQVYFEGLSPAPTSVSILGFVALVFENVSWVLLIFPIFHLMMIFPNGSLLSPRWKFLIGLETVMILTIGLLSAFSVEIGLLDADWTVPNPIGFIPVDFFSGPFEVAWAVGLVTVTFFGVVAPVLRFRRAGRVERQQIKWMLIAVINFGVVYIAAAALGGFAVGGLLDTLLGLSINLLAVAIAFGVLKYRLFDIDRFVSRTVGYVLVVGLLAVVYVGLAVWLPTSLAGDSALFVAGATLAVAFLFNPVRRVVLHWVDRRFYRSRYDMERLVDEFGNRLRNQTDIDALTTDWVGVVTETLQPSAVGVWIKH